jgi:hypothetical protein
MLSVARKSFMLSVVYGFVRESFMLSVAYAVAMKSFYAESTGASSYLIIVRIRSCLLIVEKDLLCLLGEFEQHDSNMFCTKCYTNVLSTLTMRFAVANFSAKFTICEQRLIAACTIKHNELVFYGKWSNFAVS